MNAVWVLIFVISGWSAYSSGPVVMPLKYTSAEACTKDGQAVVAAKMASRFVCLPQTLAGAW